MLISLSLLNSMTISKVEIINLHCAINNVIQINQLLNFDFGLCRYCQMWLPNSDS